MKTRIEGQINLVRIIPRGSFYMLELIYEKDAVTLNLDEKRVLGIDLGLTNIATLVYNTGLKPTVIKGGAVRSINQFYNKQRAKYKSIKDKQGYTFETKRLQRLVKK